MKSVSYPNGRRNIGGWRGFTPELLDEIRSRLDLVGLIAAHVPLKKAGANWKGLCPFHAEKTPSFMVNPGRGIFRCFGCGAGGDAFGFFMRVERATFPEAVRRLAERAGVALPAADLPARPVRPRPLLEEALTRARAEGERQRARLERYRDLYAIADYLRPRYQAAPEARRVAPALGDCERAWNLLDLAAKVERKAWAVEAELDDLLPFPWREDLDAPLGGDLDGEVRS